MRRRSVRFLARLPILAAAPVATALLVTACSEPFEDDACPAASCKGEGPSCRAYDFAGSACPTDFQLSGDTSNPDVIGECQGGKLHVAAKDTLDITASLGLDAPDTEYTMRISTRLAVTDWDGGAVLELRVGAARPFVLRASMTPAGNVSYDLCHGVTCVATYESAPGKEHRFDFDVSASGTVATVDCQPFGTTTALALPTSTGIELSFGKTDGQPIDGTLDDVVVAFR